MRFYILKGISGWKVLKENGEVRKGLELAPQAGEADGADGVKEKAKATTGGRIHVSEEAVEAAGIRDITWDRIAGRTAEADRRGEEAKAMLHALRVRQAMAGAVADVTPTPTPAPALEATPPAINMTATDAKGTGDQDEDMKSTPEDADYNCNDEVHTMCGKHSMRSLDSMRELCDRPNSCPRALGGDDTPTGKAGRKKCLKAMERADLARKEAKMLALFEAARALEQKVTSTTTSAAVLRKGVSAATHLAVSIAACSTNTDRRG